MRRMIIASFACLSVFCFSVLPAQGAALKGEQIKQVLVGNTIEYEVYRGDEYQKRWLYYKNDKSGILLTEDGRTVSRGWWVTPEGEYCHKTSDDELCWSAVEHVNNRLIMRGSSTTSDRHATLLKGNPKGLE